jgi:hypothetical protein
MQGLSSRHRALILFNGETSAEVDFSGQHIQLLRQDAGLPVVDDPYDWNGKFDRKTLKLGALMAINCETREQAIRAFNSTGSVHKGSEVIAEIEQMLHELEGYLFTDQGARLMAVDSAIMMKAILLATEAQVPVLPVHDSLVCPSSQIGFVRGCMKGAANALGYRDLPVKF